MSKNENQETTKNEHGTRCRSVKKENNFKPLRIHKIEKEKKKFKTVGTATRTTHTHTHPIPQIILLKTIMMQ